MRYFLLLSSLALLSLPSPSLAGWGGGSCGPVGPPVAVESGYRWERCTTDPDCWGLRLDGIQVGGWRQSTGTYRPFMGGVWGERTFPPVSLPVDGSARVSAPALPTKPCLPAKEKTAKKESKDECPCCGENCNCSVRPCGKPGCRCVLPGTVVESDGTLNFGLDRARIERPAKRILNGNEVSKGQLLAALGGKASLKDDSGELALTVIGSEQERRPVLSDLSSSPALAPFKGKIKLQAYTPDHWAVKDAGFATTGHPTIYCQVADGKVVHRQDAYEGPEALAESLRKADPAYNPALDPNLNHPLGGFSPDAIIAWAKDVPPWVWVAMAFVLYLRFGHKEGA